MASPGGGGWSVMLIWIMTARSTCPSPKTLSDCPTRSGATEIYGQDAKPGWRWGDHHPRRARDASDRTRRAPIVASRRVLGQQEQLSDCAACLHVGMRPCGMREGVRRPDTDLQLSTQDPVEELFGARTKRLGRRHMVAEGRIPDLDAVR